MEDQAIHEAAKRGDLDLVKRLIAEDASLVELSGEDDYTPLLISSRFGHAAIVEWLIESAGADIKAEDSEGENALYLSSFRGHLEVVSFLLKRGADFYRLDSIGSSPFLGAVFGEHVDIIDLYLSHYDIDIDFRTYNGLTALFCASMEGNDELLSKFLGLGADARIPTNDGTSPLDVARFHGHNGCIQLHNPHEEALLVAPAL